MREVLFVVLTPSVTVLLLREEVVELGLVLYDLVHGSRADSLHVRSERRTSYRMIINN